MPKPKLTDEQKRAKAIKHARWAVVAWPTGFLLYVGLLCLYLVERYETVSKLDGYDALQLSTGLLLAAYGYADAKYTLHTNGKELGSVGYAVALLLFYGVQFARNVNKHGFSAHFWSCMLAAWLLIIPIAVWKVLQLRRIRSESNRQG